MADVREGEERPHLAKEIFVRSLSQSCCESVKRIDGPARFPVTKLVDILRVPPASKRQLCFGFRIASFTVETKLIEVAP